MDAGKYREKVLIEMEDRTVDRIGNRRQTWLEFYKGYAYVNNLTGSEYWAAAQTQAEETVVFTMRYVPILRAVNSTDYRIVFRGAHYNITSVDNVQYKNETIKFRAVKAK